MGSIFQLIAVVVAGSVPDSVFDRTAPWQPVSNEDGVTLEERPVQGSPLKEYRLTTLTEFAPQRLCDAAFEWGTRGKDQPGVTLSKLITDGVDSRVVYNRVAQPLISDRDYTVTTTRERLPGGGCRVRFKITNELGPASSAQYLRMENMWGSWAFEPVQGKTKLTYVLFADPGGSVPPFLVQGGAQRSAKMGIGKVLETARASR
jgi:hypothetical protein